MKIGVYARILNREQHGDFVNKFFRFLSDQGITCLVHPVLHQTLREWQTDFTVELLPEHLTGDEIDILFSLGGDGTVLDTLSIVRDTGTPVLGVNLGRFGFLASSQQDNFEQNFEAIKKGNYSIDPRSVLQLDSDLELFNGFPYSLNDFIIHKKDTSSMITVHTSLNGEQFNSYWADGLIIATPTGSSGYSLSCGGPIVFPGSASFAVTPIAPHNLTVRPLIIGDNNEISFSVDSRTEDFLVTLDNRSVSVQRGTKLVVKKASFVFNMVRLPGHSYSNTLRNKLMWGLDKRN
ncbi:MAG: NAD kinase [Bacteroidia bacterium]|nr:NAD kinase [Bacteroidia bacterium]